VQAMPGVFQHDFSVIAAELAGSSSLLSISVSGITRWSYQRRRPIFRSEAWQSFAYNVPEAA